VERCLTPVLCLNSGSSSLKFAVYRVGSDETRIAHGAVERIGLAPSRVWLQMGGDEPVEDTHRQIDDHASAAREVFATLARHGLEGAAAVGHRVVHGGPELSTPRRVDGALLAVLHRLVALAPLHLPSEIAIIEAIARERPELPQIVCFDTAFHRGMPESAQRLPLPRALWDDGVRRYGFHGLSYEYVVWKLGPAARGRLIIAHLGSGASLAAVLDGRPVDTTMGLTPLGGLVMGTRPGDLDPGILLYMLQARGYDAAGLGALLNDESGLRGLSGSTSDMKTLLERRATDARAAEAVEIFCTSVQKHVGAFATVLGGVDTLVFTGAIGERAAPVRWEIGQRLRHLGVELDGSKNDAAAEVISVAAARCTVRIVPTNEELMIARHTAAVIASAAPGSL
jgi:acetate kinase